MPYLIDGHNLIGSMLDIQLDDPEDEIQLIRRLSEFLKTTRKSGTVYFDQRSQASHRKYKSGRLKIEFITPPDTADIAIQNRLRQLKGEARNYTVISSDHEVMQAARNAGSKVLDSRAFAQQLESSPIIRDENEKPEGNLTPEDLQFWQQIFKNSPKID
jgi:predicted RNA-binding protein with PIN domain